jgi:hypothetical protein
MFSMRFGGIARKMAAAFVTAIASMTGSRVTIYTVNYTVFATKIPWEML